MTAGRETQEAGTEEAYNRVVTIAGVPVRCDPKIKSWGGWPKDVEMILRRWNGGSGGHTLSFYGMRAMCRYATGFDTLTKKCSECDGFFNQASAGWLDKRRWVCDDCLIALARSSPSGSLALLTGDCSQSPPTSPCSSPEANQ